MTQNGAVFPIGGCAAPFEFSAVLMSALGQKQTSKRLQPMSALPPKADIGRHGGNVRFVPQIIRCARN
jgi:hypothetical protein